MHQHRAAYDLCGTEYSDFTHVDLDVGLRERLHVSRIPGLRSL